MVLGPLMDPVLGDSIQGAAAELRGVEIVRSSKSVLNLVAGADLVVSMGGYNTVIEALTARKRLIICPRVTPRTEQVIRAKAIAARGLARVVRIDRESPKALALAIRQALANPPPPPGGILLDGADRVAEILLSAGAVREEEAMTA
jgi:predicted glycosyltransferase